MKILTEEIEIAIATDYKNGVKANEIRSIYHISAEQLKSILDKHGVQMRRPYLRNDTNNGKKQKICSICNRKIPVYGARFCCFCGADVLTPEEHLAERIKKMLPDVMLLPENSRDEWMQTLNEIILIFEGEQAKNDGSTAKIKE